MNGDAELNSGAMSYVNCNLDWLSRLPKYCLFSTEFITVETSGKLQSLEKRGIIRKVDTIRPDTDLFDDRNSKKTIWHLSQEAIDYIENLEENRGAITLPCGHIGFTNLSDSPFYQCNECCARFTREEMEDYNDVW